MLYSLDPRRGWLLTNSLHTQTSGAELHQIKLAHSNEGSSVRLTQPSIGEVPTASLESCRFVSRWSSFASPIARLSERPVTPRVESTKPHSLSQPAGRRNPRLKDKLLRTKGTLAVASGG